MIWSLLALCLLLSFVLSGLEAAVLTASRVRARHRAGQGDDRRAAALDRMLGQRDRLLAAVTVANSAAGLGAFLTVTLTLVHRLGPAGYAWAFALWLPIYLVLFELVPKSLFPRFPYRMLERFTPLLQMLYWTLGGLARAAAPLESLLPKRAPTGEPDPDAFARLAESAGRHGALTDTEQARIRSVLAFRQLTVAEVMLPLAKVTAVPKAMPADRVVQIAHATGLDHLPVMSEQGDLIGLVDVLDTLRQRRVAGCARDLAQPLAAFAPDERAIRALAQLRAANAPTGGVFSPSGTPLGIISTDDILRHLFTPNPHTDGQSE